MQIVLHSEMLWAELCRTVIQNCYFSDNKEFVCVIHSLLQPTTLSLFPVLSIMAHKISENMEGM